MTFYRKTASLIMIPALLFCAMEADVEVIISIPKAQENTANIGTFYLANHQSYPLTPEQLKRNNNQNPLFSPNEAITILQKGKALLKDIPKDQYVPLPLTIKAEAGSNPLYVTINEEEFKSFELIPLKKNLKKVPIKLYLIDLSNRKRNNKPIELTPGKKYTAKRVNGRSLYLYIPQEEGDTSEKLNLSDYRLPLEVVYHAP